VSASNANSGGAASNSIWRNKLTIAAEVAAVIAVIVGLLAWLFPQDQNRPRSTSNSTSATTPPSARTSPTSPTSSAAPVEASGRYLTDIEPSAGKSYLEASPRPHTLRVRCASGQSTDSVREIAYPLYRYRKFQAVVRATGSAPKETQIQVQVFADANPRGKVLVPIDGSARITADVSGATLTLRLICESPDGVAEIDDPLLSP